MSELPEGAQRVSERGCGRTLGGRVCMVFFPASGKLIHSAMSEGCYAAEKASLSFQKGVWQCPVRSEVPEAARVSWAASPSAGPSPSLSSFQGGTAFGGSRKSLCPLKIRRQQEIPGTCKYCLCRMHWTGEGSRLGAGNDFRLFGKFPGSTGHSRVGLDAVEEKPQT